MLTVHSLSEKNQSKHNQDQLNSSQNSGLCPHVRAVLQELLLAVGKIEAFVKVDNDFQNEINLNSRKKV